MEDFAKTRNGKKFFENDIPKLVDSIQKLTSAIFESNKIEEKKLLLEQKRFLLEKTSDRNNTKIQDEI